MASGVKFDIRTALLLNELCPHTIRREHGAAGYTRCLCAHDCTAGHFRFASWFEHLELNTWLTSSPTFHLMSERTLATTPF
jgi:hypothetical protein